jgi:hypothetical protein
MRFPFSRQINSTVESDRRLPVKLGAGALLGLIVGSTFALQWARDHGQGTPLIAYAIIIAGFVLFSVSLVMVLSLKDVIRQRMVDGQPVSAPAQLLFLSGYLSLATWVSVAFIFSIVAAILLF